MKKILIGFLFLFLFGGSNAISDELTVYSDVDGWVAGNSTVWTTARSLATGSSVNTTADYGIYSAAAYEFSPRYYINRSFLRFDTSALPGGSIISSVTLSLYPPDPSQGGDGYIMAMEGTQGDTITTADFDAFTGSTFGNVSFQEDNGAYEVITFNATGIASINDDGYTYICCREYTYDYIGTSPPQYTPAMCFYYSEYTGTDRDPKLTITYTPLTISGTLKDKESDVSGSAIDYLIVNRSTGAVVDNGTSDADGTYSGTADGEEDDIYMIDLSAYKSKVIGEQVVGE